MNPLTLIPLPVRRLAARAICAVVTAGEHRPSWTLAVAADGVPVAPVCVICGHILTGHPNPPA